MHMHTYTRLVCNIRKMLHNKCNINIAINSKKINKQMLQGVKIVSQHPRGNTWINGMAFLLHKIIFFSKIL